MALKKNKLVAKVNYDFILLGIVAGVKEYRLAWHLNQSSHFHFIKSKDINIEFKDLSRMQISNYVCESEQHVYTLLKNKLVSSNAKKNRLLLPELVQFDFFLKLQSQIDDFDIRQMIEFMRDVKVIQYLARLDVEKIKQKENLLY